jgi:hypothetical protein
VIRKGAWLIAMFSYQNTTFAINPLSILNIKVPIIQESKENDAGEIHPHITKNFCFFSKDAAVK